MSRLPAEWERQSGVQLTWPHCETEWYELEKVLGNYEAKMEEAIKNIPGVTDASMNFMTQKLTLELEDDVNVEEIVDKAQEEITKVSIVCEIIRK